MKIHLLRAELFHEDIQADKHNTAGSNLCELETRINMLICDNKYKWMGLNSGCEHRRR